MALKKEIEEILKKEIRQAKSASGKYRLFHVFLFGGTISLGAATTFLTSTNMNFYAWLAPLLAVLTTALGTVANQTDFKKKSAGYRITKTEFQNLELELLKENSDEVCNSYVDKISHIRNQKVARTEDAG